MFNVEEIVKLVADGILGRVDTNIDDYLEHDFSDLGVQDSMVREELKFHLDWELADVVGEEIAESVLEHPEMELCFEAVEGMVDAYKADLMQARSEEKWMNDQYRRDVL
ncbi:hypothetical protein D1872_89760 [compost metagenome]